MDTLNPDNLNHLEVQRLALERDLDDLLAQAAAIARAIAGKREHLEVVVATIVEMQAVGGSFFSFCRGFFSLSISVGGRASSRGRPWRGRRG